MLLHTKQWTQFLDRKIPNLHIARSFALCLVYPLASARSHWTLSQIDLGFDAASLLLFSN